MLMAATPARPHILMMSEITADGKLTLKKGASSKILMKYMAHETEILLHRHGPHTTRSWSAQTLSGSITLF